MAGRKSTTTDAAIAIAQIRGWQSAQGTVVYGLRGVGKTVLLNVAEEMAREEGFHVIAFTASAPNEKWAADFTFIWTAEGWLYVAVVVDWYSRGVVGSMQPTMTSQLVTDALTMAVWRRGAKQTGEQTSLLLHSDRGSQYTSESFQRLLGH